MKVELNAVTAGRWMVILILFLTMFVGWHWIFQAWYLIIVFTWKTYVGVLVFAILFASAIALVHHNRLQDAVTYGILLGLLVFGTVNSVLLVAQNTVDRAVFDTLFGVALGALLAGVFFWLERRL